MLEGFLVGGSLKPTGYSCPGPQEAKLNMLQAIDHKQGCCQGIQIDLPYTRVYSKYLIGVPLIIVAPFKLLNNNQVKPNHSNTGYAHNSYRDTWDTSLNTDPQNFLQFLHALVAEGILNPKA